MADFFQNEEITTLQQLNRKVSLKPKLEAFAKKRRLTLLLPALYSELQGPAMKKILKQLREVTYIHHMAIVLDQAEEEEFKEAKSYFHSLFPNLTVLWINGPRIQKLFQILIDEGFPVETPGKGRSVWMGFGWILADGKADVIALHDCDVVNYSTTLLDRLVYPLMDRKLGFAFAKGYYARATKKLYGRVTRLLVTPLIRALKHILGRLRFFEYLDSFRYPLAGEFALIAPLANTIRIASDWGLEISTLGEVYQNVSLKQICQVELMDCYEHKHQPLHPNQAKRGLMRMAVDIGRTFFRILSNDGIVMSDAFFRTLISAYGHKARQNVEKYKALADINGFAYDIHKEISYVESFSQALQIAINHYKENPEGIPLIPSWRRIWAALPKFDQHLLDAVREDNQS